MMRIPQNESELTERIKQCKRIAFTQGLLSGASSAIPLPGADAVIDLANMANALNKINRRFGLSPEQVEGFTEAEKTAFQAAVSASINQVAGKYVTKELIKKLLAKLGIKIATKQATKLAVGIGTAISVGIGYTAFVQLCNSHIRDCETAVRAVWKERK